VAQPDNAGDAIHWGPDCRLDPGDPSGSRCIVTVDNIRTLAAVAFGDEGVPDAGFLIMPRIRVVRAGSGDGSVSGTGIDCGTACAIQPRYQSRVDLEASAAAGSSFVRWEGVCSTTPTCAFAAGSATVVRALFERDPAAPWNPRVLKTSVRGHRSRRAITLVVAVDRPAGARVRLFRGRRTATARTFALAPGSNTLRLRVPRSAKRGSYRLSVIVFAGADSTTTKRTVRVPR
jgi:hypothetical protein